MKGEVRRILRYLGKGVFEAVVSIDGEEVYSEQGRSPDFNWTRLVIKARRQYEEK